MKHILKSEILGGAVFCRIFLIFLELFLGYRIINLLIRVITGTGDAADVGLMLGLLVLFMGFAIIMWVYFSFGIRCVPFYGEKYKLRELADQLNGEVFEPIESDSFVVRSVTKVSENWVKICGKYFPKKGLCLIETGHTRHSYYYMFTRNDGVKYPADYVAPLDAIIMLFWDMKIIEDLSKQLGIKTRKQLNELNEKSESRQMPVSYEKRKIVTDEDSITPQEKAYLEKEIRPIIENNLERNKKSLVALGRYIYGPGRKGCFKYKGYWFVYEVDEFNESVIDGLFDVKEAGYILVASALDMPGAFPKDKIPEEGGLYQSFSSIDGIITYLSRNKKKLAQYKK